MDTNKRLLIHARIQTALLAILVSVFVSIMVLFGFGAVKVVRILNNISNAVSSIDVNGINNTIEKSNEITDDIGSIFDFFGGSN